MPVATQSERECSHLDEGLFESVVSAAKDAIIILNNDGKIIFWNAAAESVFGYAAAETLGRDVHEMLAPQRYLNRCATAFERFRLTGQGAAVGRTIELTALRKGGAEFPVELSLSAVKRDGVWHAVAIMRDITERKRVEEELRRFRAALDICADSVFVIDCATMRCVDVNETACRELGYSRDELLNLDPQGMQRPLAAGRLRERLDGVLKGEVDAGVFVTMLRRRSGTEYPVEVKFRSGTQDGRRVIVAVAREVSSQPHSEAADGHNEERLRTILDAIQAGVILIDAETHTIIDINPAALSMFGAGRDVVVGSKCHQFICPAECGQCPVTDLGQTVDNSERLLVRADGRVTPILKTVVPVVLDGRRCLLESFVDIARRKQVENELAVHRGKLEELARERSEKLLEAQRQVLQGEKLASVGRLAAGVAHEINTPIQYVGDNLHAISDFLVDLEAVVTKYREIVGVIKQAGTAQELVQKVETAEQEHDLDFILTDAPKAVGQALDGVQRVAKIVRAMKDFSHVKTAASSGVDINRCLESTLTVARNEYKYHADLKTEFGEIPLVECYPSELNQVFLNLLINAAHAIEDTGQRGLITVSTRGDGQWVEVTISDTGNGIPENIRDKVYDPFFTTKEVGKGTGQGLYIARQIVVVKHGGSLEFESEVGKGTTFRIRIPMSPPPEEEGKGEAGGDQN
jgi:two-component system, NtrC family, sensor kinase